MTSAAQFLNQLFYKVLFVSLQAAMLVALVGLAIYLFRSRLAPHWRYVLWTLVLIRLCLPLAPETAFSIYNLVVYSRPAAGTGFHALENHPPGTDVRDTAVAGSTEFGATQSAMKLPEARSGVDAVDAPVVSGTMRTVAGKTGGSWKYRLGVIWLLGSMILGVRLVLGHAMLSRRLRRLRPVTNTELLDLLEDCKAEMGMHAPITLLESDLVATPALLGFVRPCFVVNPWVLRHFSREELRHIMLHELAHLKRLDIPATWLMEILRIVHWFNPALWFAFVMMRAEREAACDALVLARVRRNESRSYGETLLKLMSKVSRPVLAAGFMGILERREAVKSRIRLISIFHSRRGHPLFALVLTVLLAGVGLTDAKVTSVDYGPSYAEKGYANLLRLSGGSEIDPVLRDFAAARWRAVGELALGRNVAIEPEIEKFFAYAAEGDWILATALFKDVESRRNDLLKAGGVRDVDNAVWNAALETHMAFEQFIRWDSNALRRYARDILKGAGNHAVLFLGTDSARAVISAFNEVRPESNVIIVAQHKLDDPSYTDYVRTQYGDRLQFAGPTQEQGDNLPADNAALRLFENNKGAHDFLVEEGEVMSWMLPSLEPKGLLMKLKSEKIEGRFNESVVWADREFWNSRTNELIEKPTCEISSQQAVTYSRMRAAIAGLYEYRSMPEEAEYAYQQARLICPRNVDVAFKLADFYVKNGRDRESLAVLLDVQQHDPSSPKLAEKIRFVSERITRKLARVPKDSGEAPSR